MIQDESQWSFVPTSPWSSIATLADEAGVEWIATAAHRFALMDAGIHPLAGIYTEPTDETGGES